MEHLPSWTSQALLQSLSGLDSRPKGEQAEEDYRSGTYLKLFFFVRGRNFVHLSLRSLGYNRNN